MLKESSVGTSGGNSRDGRARRAVQALAATVARDEDEAKVKSQQCDNKLTAITATADQESSPRAGYRKRRMLAW